MMETARSVVLRAGHYAQNVAVIEPMSDASDTIANEAKGKDLQKNIQRVQIQRNDSHHPALQCISANAGKRDDASTYHSSGESLFIIMDVSYRMYPLKSRTPKPE